MILENQDDMLADRLIIGQILTRFALELQKDDPLPCKNELISLENAQIKSCRGNLVRSIAMKLLSGLEREKSVKTSRQNHPCFSACVQDISTWDDDQFFPFLVRFFDYLNSYKYKSTGSTRIKDHLAKLQSDIYNGDDIWLQPEFLQANGFEIIIRGLRQQEMFKSKLEFSWVPYADLERLNRIPGVKYYKLPDGETMPDYEIFPDDVIVNMSLTEGPSSIYRSYIFLISAKL